jgi:hypothetical protein
MSSEPERGTEGLDASQALPEGVTVEIQEGEDSGGPAGLTRRAVIRRGGVVIGTLLFAAYAAPQMVTLNAPPAYAQATPPPPDWIRPTCAQIAANATVVACITTAWANSQSHSHANRHERGFWIIQQCIGDRGNVTLRCGVEIAGTRASITPGADPSGANERAVGFFHTHPNPATDEKGKTWTPGPSGADTGWHTGRGLCGVLVHHTGLPPFGAPPPPPARSGGVTF